MRKDLEDLDKVAEVLKKHNIQFWMYGGALAGFVKIKDLFPWDGDIDLFVWDKDWKNLLSIRDEFGLDYKIKGICLAFESKGGKDIDIMPFKRDDEKGIAYFERIHLSDPGKGGKLSKMIFFGPLQNSLKKGRYRLAWLFYNLTEMFGGEVIRQEVPLKYFDNLKEIDLFGVKLKVPEDHEGFMDYTYGKYWRKPVEKQTKHFDREHQCNPSYYINKTKENTIKVNELFIYGGIVVAFSSVLVFPFFGVKIASFWMALGLCWSLTGWVCDRWQK